MGRLASANHLGAALRYVVLNPVRARLVGRAADWPWSSLHAWLGADDGLTASGPVRDRVPDIAAMVAAGEDEEKSRRLRQAETIGRPLGDARFIAGLERASGRTLQSARRGRPPKIGDSAHFRDGRGKK